VRIQSILIAAAIVATAAVMPAAAQHDHHDAKGVTVQGEVLDMACYMAHEGKGPQHAACAAMCLNAGQPMGLLAKDGTVYLLTGDHDDTSAFVKAKEFAGKNVEITGETANRAGIKAITVKSVKPL
jgi:hypothetical protein